ncbi:MAG: alpha-glucuronidase [Bacteroidaceae bacterium]|nr:alpha-glucuronidase [Bacteroidaceae bacterium]
MKRFVTFILALLAMQVMWADNIGLRLLNHWDNLDGTIERGYAGRSIFFSKGKVDFNPTTIVQYAKTNQKAGINGTVLNNVNASPKMMTREILEGVKEIADILRVYNIKVYLSVNFASPKALGELDTADPLDEGVRKWWKDKAAEIYSLIPDFGGFLVKANSEGQPGPMDFGRTHADGANMLADALKPYGGLVMWRAFVYAANSPDRACQAYNEFVPLDGQFHDNVILQIKNGPIDFQPREPVSALFFAMKKTRLMPEFQLTQEYLGESIHTVFMPTLWREFFDTLKPFGIHFDAVAGVSNVGDCPTMCGNRFAVFNWIAFGKFMSDTDAKENQPEQLAHEMLQTMSNDKKFVKSVTKIMLESWEACVDYMMPLGLHHIFAGGHHYGPEPWYYVKGLREDWLPRYYHKADDWGMGFDRTKNGSGYTAQYPEPLQTMYDDINTCPENLLLFFHHVSWDYKMKNGKTLWQNLCLRYDEGVKKAESFVKTWKKMKPYVGAEIYEEQLAKFERQAKDAWWWRDACLLYFQQFSKKQLPKGCPAPRHKLEDLMNFQLMMDNFTAADPAVLP